MNPTLTEQITEMFAGHTLVAISDDGQVLCWLMMSNPHQPSATVEITITPEGIHLMGAGVPCQDRNGIQAQKPPEWWVSEASPEYLARNFLTTTWNRDEAQRHFRWLQAQVQARIDEGADAEELLHNLQQDDGEDPFVSAIAWERSLGEALADLVDNNVIDSTEIHPNEIYDPKDVALLAAIHQRFRALFMETYTLAEGHPTPRNG